MPPRGAGELSKAVVRGKIRKAFSDTEVRQTKILAGLKSGIWVAVIDTAISVIDFSSKIHLFRKSVFGRMDDRSGGCAGGNRPS